jgi:hypothetical protein
MRLITAPRYYFCIFDRSSHNQFTLMKKILQLCLSLTLLAFISTVTTSCSKKTGCPINESVHVKTDKNGQMKSKKGKSNLFPKDMRKKRRG